MATRNRKAQKSRRAVMTFLAFWALLFMTWAVIGAIHVAGWLILTVALCALTYFLGQRKALDRFLPARLRKRETWPLPGRVVETDAVSAYPTELTDKIRRSSEYGKPRTRADLLRDPLSGAKPLHPER